MRVNDHIYPVFIEYKNVQDKLKLKVYLELHLKDSVTLQELFIGAH